MGEQAQTKNQRFTSLLRPSPCGQVRFSPLFPVFCPLPPLALPPWARSPARPPRQNACVAGRDPPLPPGGDARRPRVARGVAAPAPPSAPSSPPPCAAPHVQPVCRLPCGGANPRLPAQGGRSGAEEGKRRRASWRGLFLGGPRPTTALLSLATPGRVTLTPHAARMLASGAKARVPGSAGAPPTLRPPRKETRTAPLTPPSTPLPTLHRPMYA